MKNRKRDLLDPEFEPTDEELREIEEAFGGAVLLERQRIFGHASLTATDPVELQPSRYAHSFSEEAAPFGVDVVPKPPADSN